MIRLQQLSTGLVEQTDLASILNAILDAALEITPAVRGKIQLLDEAAGTLRIALRGGSGAYCDLIRIPFGIVKPRSSWERTPTSASHPDMTDSWNRETWLARLSRKSPRLRVSRSHGRVPRDTDVGEDEIGEVFERGSAEYLGAVFRFEFNLSAVERLTVKHELFA